MLTYPASADLPLALESAARLVEEEQLIAQAIVSGTTHTAGVCSDAACPCPPRSTSLPRRLPQRSDAAAMLVCCCMQRAGHARGCTCVRPLTRCCTLSGRRSTVRTRRSGGCWLPRSSSLTSSRTGMLASWGACSCGRRRGRSGSSRCAPSSLPSWVRAGQHIPRYTLGIEAVWRQLRQQLPPAAGRSVS